MTPQRSLDQRMDALARANEIRIKRAQLKLDLKAGRLRSTRSCSTRPGTPRRRQGVRHAAGREGCQNPDLPWDLRRPASGSIVRCCGVRRRCRPSSAGARGVAPEGRCYVATVDHRAPDRVYTPHTVLAAGEAGATLGGRRREVEGSGYGWSEDRRGRRLSAAAVARDGMSVPRPCPRTVRARSATRWPKPDLRAR
jgi:hypothetical protein